MGHQFVIETDHKSFKELLNQVVRTLDQHYYLSKLLTSPSLFILSTPSDYLNHLLLEDANLLNLEALRRDVEAHQHQDPTFKSLREYYIIKEDHFKQYSSIKPSLLQEFHNTPSGGHSSVAKTFSRLNANIYWEVKR